MLTPKQWVGWIVALAAAVVLVVLATLPPFLHEPFRNMVMQAFHTVCHQIPERSPHVAGVQLAVCHRCYGMYVGLVFGVLCFLYARRWDNVLMHHAAFILIGAVALPGTDWLAHVVGMWTNTALTRLVTGSAFGIVGGYYLARAVAVSRRARTPAASPEPAENPV